MNDYALLKRIYHRLPSGWFDQLERRTPRSRRLLRRAVLRSIRDGAGDVTWPRIGLLWWAWGNRVYSASIDYLEVLRDVVERTEGDVLECGSGLSTLFGGSLLARLGQGRRWLSLEHDEGWASEVNAELTHLKLDRVRSVHARLTPYLTFDWYAGEAIPGDAKFELVVCDGPPGTTRGGRFGALPVLERHLRDRAWLLLDDTAREGERAAVQAWRDAMTDWRVTSELEAENWMLLRLERVSADASQAIPAAPFAPRGSRVARRSAAIDRLAPAIPAHRAPPSSEDGRLLI